MPKLNENLLTLRNKAKLTQLDVADFLNVERNTYIKWENGTADVKSAHIPKLAELFQVEIADLFKDDNKISITNTNTDNKDNSIGQKDLQQGIIINIADNEIAKELSEKLEMLINTIKNQ